MTERKLESSTVLFADLPNGTQDNLILLEKTIKAAVQYYLELFGKPRRIWVNGKDIPPEEIYINEIKVERKSGCPRGKVMVM